MSVDLEALYDLDDVAAAAEEHTSDAVWDFVQGGSGGERSVSANRSALESAFIVPRVLKGVSRPDMRGCFLDDEPASMPVAIAPMAYQRLLHPEGELAAAQAAKIVGIPFIVPMLSSVAVERIAQDAGTVWLQLYWLHDRSILKELIERSEAAGCSALVLTADVPRMGRRLRDIRNGFRLPADVSPVHLTARDAEDTQRHTSGQSAVALHTQQSFDPTFDWSCIEWLRGNTRLPIVVKGILDPRDAAIAESLGIRALVVSNHGGRQLDGALSGFSALPAVRDAVGERCAVWVDGGFRTGGDLVKAMARGASAVLVGRPVLWGLAVGGAQGVVRVLNLLRQELEDAMSLAGCAAVRDMNRLKIVTGRPSRWGRV